MLHNSRYHCQVVGAEEGVNPGKSRQEESGREEGGERSITSTREDIRKKLASWGEEEEEQEGQGRGKEERGENNNLEICFINETASDDEEESFRNPLDEEEEKSEDEFVEEQEVRTAIPRSKSEGFCLRGGGGEGRGIR